MVTAVPTGGTLGITHYNEIERASSKNDVLTVRSNGKENYLVAGRSLAERFIIVLNSTCLGSLGFIKSLYEALERREAQAISCFSSALANIYGEDAKNIVDTHLQGNGKIKSSDICTIVDRVTKESSSYRSCDNRDKAIEAKIKLSFQDFDLSHVNNCDFDLFDNLSNEVDGLISNIGGRERFSNEEKVHHLKTALMDFITSMPASSDTFMAAFSHVENDVVAPEYHINDINLNKNSRVYLTAENMSTLLQGAGLLKEELLLSGVQDAYRHQVYAARFNEGVGNVDTASRTSLSSLSLSSVLPPPSPSPSSVPPSPLASALPPPSPSSVPPSPLASALPPPSPSSVPPSPLASVLPPPSSSVPPSPLASVLPPPSSSVPSSPLSSVPPPPPPPPPPTTTTTTTTTDNVGVAGNNPLDESKTKVLNKTNITKPAGKDYHSELLDKLNERNKKKEIAESGELAKKKLI